MEHLILNIIGPILQQLLIVIAGIGIGLVIKWLNERFGLDIKKSQAEYLERVAEQAVLKAEGRAMRYLADKGTKLVGDSKYINAVDELLNSVPELTQEQAKHLVDMAVVRIPGIGKKDIK